MLIQEPLFDANFFAKVQPIIAAQISVPKARNPLRFKASEESLKELFRISDCNVATGDFTDAFLDD